MKCRRAASLSKVRHVLADAPPYYLANRFTANGYVMVPSVYIVMTTSSTHPTNYWCPCIPRIYN